jgi:hypothetical protein
MATMTVTEFAAHLDTDARTARKFLRSVTPADEQPGKGGRWAIEKRDARSLTKKFAAYIAERTPEVPNDDAPEGDEGDTTPDTASE